MRAIRLKRRYPPILAHAEPCAVAVVCLRTLSVIKSRRIGSSRWLCSCWFFDQNVGRVGVFTGWDVSDGGGGEGEIPPPHWSVENIKRLTAAKRVL